MWDEAHRRRVVRLCAAISGDHEAAEDLAQETLLEAWRNAHKLHDPSGAERWVAAVARNVCLRRRRRAEVLVAEPPEVAVEDAPPDDLAGVPEILVLRYLHDLTHRQIGAALGISDDAVSMRLARAKQALRASLSADTWRATQIWCVMCGTTRLGMRRETETVAFRCTTCGPDSRVSVFPLANPTLGPLVAGLERPTAMFARIGAWSRSYFAGGDGAHVSCTRCAGPATVRAHRRLEGNSGLLVQCRACGEEAWTSLTGLAHAVPDAVALRRRAPRAAAQPERIDGDAVVVRIAHGADGVDVAFDRRTYRLLGAA
ncbi:MAG TPA: sigma-70 family RNA polymerase sigma factor [Gaiellaceae bacterium]